MQKVLILLKYNSLSLFMQDFSKFVLWNCVYLELPVTGIYQILICPFSSLQMSSWFDVFVSLIDMYNADE